MGHENKSQIIINGIRTKSLEDTGSQISTISKGYLKHLNPVPEIKNLDKLELDVKYADGQSLQYKVYVAVVYKVHSVRTRKIIHLFHCLLYQE